MKKNRAAEPISLEATLGLAHEVIANGAEPYAELLGKLKRAKPGTRRQRDLLCELSVAANVIEVKAKEQQLVIDEYLSSLPGDS